MRSDITVGIVAKDATGELVAERLCASGLEPHQLHIVAFDSWSDLLEFAPSICFWVLEENVVDQKRLTQSILGPACMGSCLHICVSSESNSLHSRNVLSLKELVSSRAPARIREWIEEASSWNEFRTHEQWYRVAVTDGNVGLWWWDQHLNFVYLSSHFQAMLGLMPDQLPQNANQFMQLVHPEDQPLLQTSIDQYFDSPTGQFYQECRILRRNQGYRWFSIRGQMGHRLVERNRIIGASTDIHDQKVDAINLSKANQLARSAIVAKDEFLTNMSHNLRTPLTAVLGYADVLEDLELPQDAEEHIGAIRGNGTRLLSMLEDILELSNIESSHLQADNSATSVSKLLQETLESFRPRATESGLSLNLTIHPNVPSRLSIDGTRISQVLGRLLDNAIKFTSEGSVTIVADYRTGEPSHLELSITDTGIGIPKAKLDSIFEPFQLGDNSIRRSFAGSGLGLSICRRLVAILNGELSVESTEQGGTTFFVKLPAAKLPTENGLLTSAGSQQSKNNPNKPLTGCRTLVVEDGIDNQRVLTAFLKVAGSQVDIVENGKLAVDRILESDSQYEIVLMDMQMPVMDGYEATRQLRSAGYKKPIIAVTAHALSSDRKRCLDAGCDDYFSKPIDRKALIAMVAQYYASTTEQESVAKTTIGSIG